MEQQQINRLEMLEDTNTFLDAHATVYSAVPIITKYKNDLVKLITGIKTAAKKQDASQVFIGKSKKELKRIISEKMDILDDMAEAYAEDLNHAELISKVSNSMSDYNKLANVDFEIKVKNVLEVIENEDLTEMANYGLTQELIDDVKLQFDEFEEKSGKPRAYRIASRVATQDLDGLFKEVTVVTQRLDKVMKRFKRSNTSFYNGYEAARIVMNK